MRDRQVIEREMYRAREDLEQNLADLKHAVAEKIDVKARARVAIEKGKEKAQDAFARGKHIAHRGSDAARVLAVRGKDGAIDLYGRGRETVRERPVLVGSIVAGVVAAGLLLYIAHRREWI